MSRKPGQGTEVPVGSTVETIYYAITSSSVEVKDAAGASLQGLLVRLTSSADVTYRLDGGVAVVETAPATKLGAGVERYEHVVAPDEVDNLGLTGSGLTVIGVSGTLQIDIIK
ncbi:hypothetical protein KAR91_09175 [Candidatus Pacearchaeota archaeon]|nr:hypothetical protein [Candidatus Pacearchaeota archaeon]